MSLKKNILYNILLTTSLYVLQFVTYPYVSRMLGVTGIGITNFAQSVVQYFIMFSMMGVNTLGTREIAKCNGDGAKRNKVFSDIFQLNLLVTMAVLSIYVLSILIVPKLYVYRRLLWVGAFQIVFNTFTVEWLYKGMEEFRYITLRTLFVRLLYVVLVFTLVRGPEDYALYFYLSVGVIVANGSVNLIYSRSFVRFLIQPMRVLLEYAKQMGLLGSYAIMTMMYTTFNVVYLGFVTDDYEVGIYTTAIKLHAIIVGLFTAFTTVMMSRISALRGTHDLAQIRQLLGKSYEVLYAVALPLIVLGIVYAPEIVLAVAGPNYASAVLLFRLVMPLLLVIGLEQIVVNQVLMPFGRDRQVLRGSVAGALVGVFLNIVLVPFFRGMGSAFVWTASELSVLLVTSFSLRSVIGAGLDCRLLLRYLSAFGVLMGVMWALRTLVSEWWIHLALLPLFVLSVHILLRYVLHNSTYIDALGYIHFRKKTNHVKPEP